MSSGKIFHYNIYRERGCIKWQESARRLSFTEGDREKKGNPLHPLRLFGNGYTKSSTAAFRERQEGRSRAVGRSVGLSVPRPLARSAGQTNGHSGSTQSSQTCDNLFAEISFKMLGK